jgi:hypothetical protein
VELEAEARWAEIMRAKGGKMAKAEGRTVKEE